MSHKTDSGGLLVLLIVGLIAAACGAVYEVCRKTGEVIARVAGKGGS